MDVQHDDHSGHQSGDHSGHHQHRPVKFFACSTYSALLVKSWTSATVTGLLLGVVAGVVLSLCLEALRSYIATHTMTVLLFKSTSRPPTSQRLFASLLHALDVLLAYILMLLVMSFNVYIVIAAVVGAGLGHFLVRPLLLRRVHARLGARRHLLSILSPSTQQQPPQDRHDDRDDERATIEDRFDEVVKEDERTESDPMMQCRQFSVKGKETSV